MRYEQFYNEQVEIYKKRRHFLTKRLPFILLGVGILLTLIVVLFFTSGTPYEYGISDLKYGDTLVALPKSFLGSSKYEYLVDGEYTDVMPKIPGEYTYRVASTSLFGVTKYSSEMTFTIEKGNVSVSILDTEVEYGKDPLNIKTDLPYTEKLSSYTISYQDKHLLTTKAWVSDIVITNNIGEDITSYYNIDSLKTDITFTKVPIVIALENKEKVYDGTALEFEGEEDYSVSGLLDENQKVAIVAEGSQTLVGESEYTVSSVTVTDNDGNVYEAYDYVVNNGILKVTRKEITLTTNDVELTYNGEDQALSDYTLSEEIKDNVEITPLVVNKVGKYKYELGAVFKNDEGLDVSFCYSLKKKYGTAKVVATEANITLKDLTTEYTGTSSFVADYEVTSGSLFGASLMVTVASSISEVGSGTIEAFSYILTKNDEDVSKCFKLTFSSANITITKKKIKVKPKDATKEYDGKTFTTDEFVSVSLGQGDSIKITAEAVGTEIGDNEILITSCVVNKYSMDVSSCYDITLEAGNLTITKRSAEIIILNSVITYGDSIEFGFETEGFLDGDTVTINKYDYTSSLGDNIISTSDYSVQNGSVDRLDYYNITVTNGKLTINKKNLVLAMYTKTKVYDGTELTLSDSDYYIKDGSLLTGDSITFLPSDTTITAVGSKEVVFDKENVSIQNADSEDVLGFYNIVYESGYLNITPRVLIITTGSITKPYDYNVLTLNTYTQSGLISGHVIEIEITGELFYVGSTNNTVGKIKILSSSDSNAVDVTSNYTIKVYEGTLTFTERSA